MRYDLYGRYGREARGHEQLRAVGDYSLHEARECVQKAGGTARRYAEAAGYVARYGADGYYGDGVVCGAYVGEDGERGDGGLGAAAGAYARGEARDDVVDPAADTYHFEHAAGHHGYYYEFTHRCHAAAHGDGPIYGVHGAGDEPYGAGGEYAEGEHHQYVDTHYGGCEHQQVGYDGDVRHLAAAVVYETVALREDVYGKGYDGRGGDDEQVCAELVTHGASLRAGCGYCGVGYEREVVAEECAADDYGDDPCRVAPRLLGYGRGYGREGDDGADRGAYGDRGEAGGYEEARGEELLGHHAQGECHGGVDGAHLLRGGGEGPRQHEDPYHEHDVGLRRAARVVVDTFDERLP